MTSDTTTSMSNLHQFLKAARKDGTARTDQDITFKKPFQTVGRSQTIDHNMHDDFVRNPPKNIVEGEVVPRKWVAQGKTTIQSGVLGEEELGRIKQSDVQSKLVEESSVHS